MTPLLLTTAEKEMTMRLFQVTMMTASSCVLVWAIVVGATYVAHGGSGLRFWLMMVQCVAQFAATVCAWQAIKFADEAELGAKETTRLIKELEARIGKAL